MFRIDKFLDYYQSLSGTQMQLENGRWVNARPLPFYPGFLTRDYWRIRRERRRDAKAVRQGKAIAVTWDNL